MALLQPLYQIHEGFVARGRRLSSIILSLDTLFGVFALVGIAGLWELLAYLGVINGTLLPPPSALFQEVFFEDRLHFFKLGYVQSGARFAIVNSMAASLFRVLAGIAVGFPAGIAAGCLICYYRIVARTLYPVVRLLAPISPVAWLPLAIVFFGIGNKPAVFVVVVGVFFLIAVATVACVRNVESLYVNTARTLGATRQQVMLRVVLPSILPSLFLILRINVFAAWMSVLTAEMVGVTEGLGAMVMVGRALFNMRVIFVAMLLIGVTGFLLDRILLLVQARILWWKREASLA